MDAKMKAKDAVLQKLIAVMGESQVEKLKAKSPKFAKKPEPEVVEEAAAEDVEEPAPEVEEPETDDDKALLLKLLAEMGE